jgi:hypothetical protein
MSFRLIEAERARHPVSLLCGVVGVTRGGYYAWRSRGRSARELRDGELAALIRRVFDDSGGTYKARLALFRWIEGFYNSRRRHSTLGQRSPQRYEETPHLRAGVLDAR